MRNLSRAAILTFVACVSLATTPFVRSAGAQRPTLSAAVRRFIALDTDVVALTHVRVIDGTGCTTRRGRACTATSPNRSRASISRAAWTSMRTAGSMNGIGEFSLKKSIDDGERAGPWIDVTAP
jgi:hypothetical protein